VSATATEISLFANLRMLSASRRTGGTIDPATTSDKAPTPIARRAIAAPRATSARLGRLPAGDFVDALSEVILSTLHGVDAGGAEGEPPARGLGIEMSPERRRQGRCPQRPELVEIGAGEF
jgi:hypothetical protein